MHSDPFVGFPLQQFYSHEDHTFLYALLSSNPLRYLFLGNCTNDLQDILHKGTDPSYHLYHNKLQIGYDNSIVHLQLQFLLTEKIFSFQRLEVLCHRNITQCFYLRVKILDIHSPLGALTMKKIAKILERKHVYSEKSF